MNFRIYVLVGYIFERWGIVPLITLNMNKATCSLYSSNMVSRWSLWKIGFDGATLLANTTKRKVVYVFGLNGFFYMSNRSIGPNNSVQPITCDITIVSYSFNIILEFMLYLILYMTPTILFSFCNNIWIWSWCLGKHIVDCYS